MCNYESMHLPIIHAFKMNVRAEWLNRVRFSSVFLLQRRKEPPSAMDPSKSNHVVSEALHNPIYVYFTCLCLCVRESVRPPISLSPVWLGRGEHNAPSVPMMPGLSSRPFVLDWLQDAYFGKLNALMSRKQRLDHGWRALWGQRPQWTITLGSLKPTQALEVLNSWQEKEWNVLGKLVKMKRQSTVISVMSARNCHNKWKQSALYLFWPNPWLFLYRFQCWHQWWWLFSHLTSPLMTSDYSIHPCTEHQNTLFRITICKEIKGTKLMIASMQQWKRSN